MEEFKSEDFSVSKEDEDYALSGEHSSGGERRLAPPPPRLRLAVQAFVGPVGGWRGSQAALSAHRAAGWPQLADRDLSRGRLSGPCSADAPSQRAGTRR